MERYNLIFERVQIGLCRTALLFLEQENLVVDFVILIRNEFTSLAVQKVFDSLPDQAVEEYIIKLASNRIAPFMREHIEAIAATAEEREPWLTKVVHLIFSK